MKQHIQYNTDSTWYNVMWLAYDGSENHEYVLVPSDFSYDPYTYIERYLLGIYEDEYDSIVDYVEAPVSASVMSATEEEVLDDAILNGRPFDIDTFNKYKVDPYRANGAVKADVLEVGDIIQVTEDAAEIDCPSPEIEITDIRYDDPDGYGHDCITFYCYDNETGDEYTLHFWPEEWVGPIIAKKSNYSINSATSTDVFMKWSEPYRPYSGSEHAYHTLYVDDQEVGYIDEWEHDGDWGYTAYLQSTNKKYTSLDTFKSLEDAKNCLESAASTSQYSVDSSSVTSGETINRYSDVRPYEDRKYWYFTTHGVGPGTIPKDLNVLEVREGQNEKGTWGDFICLDGVLNTDELEYHDLRELAPSNVTSDTEIDDDDDDEWSPYHGHNYLVGAGPYNDLTFWCDDPKSAITRWFKYQEKYPTDVAISCPTKSLAIQLVKAGTADFLTKLYDKFDCPYKLDWLIAECQRKLADNCQGFYENEYGYGDAVHPFSVG